MRKPLLIIIGVGERLFFVLLGIAYLFRIEILPNRNFDYD